MEHHYAIRNALKYLYILIVVTAVIVVIGFFHVIFQYLIIAFLLSYLLHPLVDYISDIQIYNRKLGRSVAILLSFSLLILAVASLFLLFLPLIAEQLENFTKVNSKELVKLIEQPLVEIEKFAIRNGLTRKKGFIVKFAEDNFANLFNSDKLPEIASNLANVTLEVLLYSFIVPIIAFFMLHDSMRMKRGILQLVPNRYFEVFINAVNKSELLLRKYLYGLLMQSFSVMVMSFITCTVLGLHNTLLIAIFFGIFNIIPYLGMVMSGIFALLINIGGQIELIVAQHETSMLTAIVIKVAIGIGIVHVIDANITQPLIFSRSINAHPLEIFIVILAGAFVAGILGMAVCIPVYMITKILVGEFAWAYRNYHTFNPKRKMM